MLGKLIKYEWRGYKVSLIVIFSILALTTLLTGLLITTLRPEYDAVVSNFSDTFMVISFMLYYFGIIGSSIGSFMIIAVRFYKTCYTDQGYLTHTLPAKTSQILSAKIITAILQYLLIMLGIAASILVLLQVLFTHMTNMGYDDFANISFSEIFYEVNQSFEYEFGISFTGLLIFILIFALLSCISAVTTIFGCISLGQLFTKHRVIGAIIAYFAVNIITQIVSFVVSIPIYKNAFIAELTGEQLTIFEFLSPTFILAMIGAIALSVIMYFISLYMMTKKLNLE